MGKPDDENMEEQELRTFGPEMFNPPGKTEIIPIKTSMEEYSKDERDIEVIAERAQKYAKIEKKLRQIAISVTNKNDWVDEGGKPYLMWSGAARVARILGVSYYDLQESEEKHTDENGEYIISKIKGKVKWKGDIIEELGTSHSRKPLIAVRKDKNGNRFMLPLSEIDRTNVTKMAYTNFLNRGLKSIVGLNFTWEEVQEYTGATPGDSGGNVDFKKSKNLDDPRRKEIADMLKELHGSSAIITLQALTTFEVNGKKVPGKKKVSDCSDKQIPRLHETVLKQFKEKYKQEPADYFKKKAEFLKDGAK